MEIAEARVREELYARVEEKDRRGFLRGIKSEFKVPENHVDDKIHRREDHYVCHLCSTVFDKADGLREHFYSHARGFMLTRIVQLTQQTLYTTTAASAVTQSSGRSAGQSVTSR